VLKDMMTRFELYRPTALADAYELIDQFGAGAWLMAGGQDSLDWFKDRAKQPRAVIELSQIEGMTGVRETADGVEIGALTTLAEIEENALVRERYGLLVSAASHVASPQIRNVGTIGGNLCQDTRCWYYRAGLSCYRAGGNICYADSPEGMNREHCLFGASRCVAVSPSDTAPALVALDASMVVSSRKGERVVRAERFFVGPDVDIQRMTALQPGEILTAIRIPSAFSSANFYFEKVAERKTWDFALVSVAAALRIESGTIRDARIVCGGVECRPRRMRDAEDAIRGREQNAETAGAAARRSAGGARPLRYNEYKIPLVENLVTRAVRDA